MIYYVIQTNNNQILCKSNQLEMAQLNQETFEEETSIVSKEEDYDTVEYVYNPSTEAFDRVLSTDMIRHYRALKFEVTVDKMNPVWYNNLTSDQQTRLAAWRQEWLDYPTTNTEPTTDVTDIFPEG